MSKQILAVPETSIPLRDKRLVAASFSRAAQTYDGVARLQREIADKLGSWLDDEPLEQVLDLGCGTGYANRWLSRRSVLPLINLDIAEGMLGFARQQGCLGLFVTGDAEQLPLDDQSVDCVWSSLAVQWSEQPDALFKELYRVVRPGGRILVSTLGPSTLNELRSAWTGTDQLQHVNQFMSIERWLGFAGAMQLRRHIKDIRVERYSELSVLLRELKALGAHNVNPDRRPGLGGQKSLKTMYKNYEHFRDQQGYLPATYEVHYLEFKR